MKKFLKMLSISVTLMLILTTIAMPISVNASTNSSNISRGFNLSSMIQMATQRYQSVNKYKKYLNEMTKFTNGLDKNMSVSDMKIQIIDKANELENKYSESSSSIPKISNQIINTTINSEATSTTDLLGTITTTLKKLLGNSNNAIESLTPDVKVEDMVATTAGERCGDTYKVKLVGKIYYANADKNGNPTSNKWVYLVHGSQMNGQAMADAVGQMYLDQGYNILAPDSRGYGNSEGSVAMGYVESLDVWDWLTYLNNTYGSKCQQVIIHGVSLGGATTVFASGLEVNGKTLKDQNVIGLVEDCGYTSLTGIIKGMLGTSNSSSGSSSNELVAKILGIIKKDDLSSLSKESLADSVIKKLLIEKIGVGLTEENFDQYQNALDSLNRCELPLLIVHGTKDSTVPFENSTEIYNTAMNNSKMPYVQRFTADGEQHAFIILGSKYNVYEGHVENFINKAEEIANGKSVNKTSDYKEETEKKTSIMTQLIKALKLIKNIIKKG